MDDLKSRKKTCVHYSIAYNSKNLKTAFTSNTGDKAREILEVINYAAHKSDIYRVNATGGVQLTVRGKNIKL